MIEKNVFESVALPDSDLVKKIHQSDTPATITFELTARCNNNCRHCYINLPQNDTKAETAELGLEQIASIADQALEQGVLWCLLTGGEPLLRDDFSDIFLMLKRKGLLVSVFTNGCLINVNHVELFKRYKPRELEITVYGISEKTYERVTGIKGSYKQFRNGLDLLLNNNIAVSLKAMVLHSNLHEIEDIEKFCSQYSKKRFRFDPFLHKRYDGNKERNEKIISERLTTAEIIRVEQNNITRKSALIANCETLISDHPIDSEGRIFTCGILKNGFEITYDGKLRLCSSLMHPEYIRDVKTLPLLQAWKEVVEKVVKARSNRAEFLKKCCQCKMINLCYFCPANSYLETGELDVPADYFCAVAHARAEALLRYKNSV